MSVEIIILLIAVAALWIFVELFLKKQSKGSTQADQEVTNNIQDIKHRKKEHLATKNEQKLYYTLLNVLPDNYVIHCQVSLLALVEPEERKHLSKVWAKRMDYVITDASTKILAVIELDDSTHKRASRIKSDEYKNHALEGHHKLVRFATENYYDQESVARTIRESTGIPCEIKRS